MNRSIILTLSFLGLAMIVAPSTFAAKQAEKADATGTNTDSGAAHTVETHKTRTEYHFNPVAEKVSAIELVKRSQQKAQKEHKLFMLVLGANWCHDSQTLASRFSEPQMHALLSAQYETLFIDVAYFEDLHYLAQRYGYPAYFGTPTVLIVAPETGSLLNRDTVPKWQSADSVPLAEYLTYFGDIGKLRVQGKLTATSQAQSWVSTAQLKAFSDQEVNRLRLGFEHLRPIWQGVIAGVADEKQLTAIATEVWEFRVQLQKNLHALHQQVKNTPKAKIQLPEYKSWSWE